MSFCVPCCSAHFTKAHTYTVLASLATCVPLLCSSYKQRGTNESRAHRVIRSRSLELIVKQISRVAHGSSCAAVTPNLLIITQGGHVAVRILDPLLMLQLHALNLMLITVCLQPPSSPLLLPLSVIRSLGQIGPVWFQNNDTHVSPPLTPPPSTNPPSRRRNECA